MFTMQTLKKCSEQGIMIGVFTSRSEKNWMEFIAELNPDVVISSAGALDYKVDPKQQDKSWGDSVYTDFIF